MKINLSEKQIRELVDRVCLEITEREDEVFPFVGNNSYVLDQNGLEEAVTSALKDVTV